MMPPDHACSVNSVAARSFQGVSSPNPKRPGGKECDFCARFRRDFAPYQAPKALIEMRQYRTPNSADINRIMERSHGPNWRKKIKKSKGAAA